MRHWPTVRYAACVFLFVWSVWFVVYDLRNQLWPLAIVQAAFGVWAVVFEIRCRRRSRRGLREAARDCERAGTDTDATTGSSAFASGLAAGITAGTNTGPGASLILRNNRFNVAHGWIMSSPFAYGHEGAGEDVRLQERGGDLPLLAFKAAQLVWKIGADFGPALASRYSSSAPWDSQDAICLGGNDHEVIPDEGCTCGFYARRSPDDVDHEPGGDAVLVDVELYGRVIVYERGYRAQHQRILRVGLGPCWYCHAPATVAGGFAPTPTHYEQRNGVGQVVVTYTEPMATTTPLFQFCDAHVDLSDTNLRMPVVELAVRLGVPVENTHSTA